MSWTATIDKINDDGLTMDVTYAREGYDPITAGVMLPAEGADLQQHLASYAPTAMWEWQDEQRVKRYIPGLGTVVHAPPEPEPVAVVEPEPATITLEPLQ